MFVVEKIGNMDKQNGLNFLNFSETSYPEPSINMLVHPYRLNIICEC